MLFLSWTSPAPHPYHCSQKWDLSLKLNGLRLEEGWFLKEKPECHSQEEPWVLSRH